MGVPSFYPWLVNKYPKIEAAATGRASSPEFDNLYLDMHGLIFSYFCEDDDDTIEEDIYFEDGIDHLFDIVKPRKLLFMSFDGVPPRAKMNQQRCRSFAKARDAKIAREIQVELRKQFQAEGKVLLLPKEESKLSKEDSELSEESELSKEESKISKEESELFKEESELSEEESKLSEESELSQEESELSDSDVFTFAELIHKVSKDLREYVNDQLDKNPAWQNIKVILSDDKAPGEGEHKIMSFIRAQRASPGYDPNTSHCLYGLDSDLIILALATHEVHFSILRGEVLPPNGVLSGLKQLILSSRGWFKNPWQPSSSEPGIDVARSESIQGDHFRAIKRQSYQFVNVAVLREYLALDMEIPKFDKFEFDLERVIDDFIFICFFAGNDFLPHLPSLESNEGCIDLLMDVYKKQFRNLGGYLVNMEKVNDKEGAYINLSRVEKFILAVGSYEEKIFNKRAHLRDKQMSRILAEYRDAKEDEKDCLDKGTSSDVIGMHDITRFDKMKISDPAVDAGTVMENRKEFKQKLKERLRNQSDLFKNGSLVTDKVKFGTPGWRERYYKEKFSAKNAKEIELTRKSVVEKYGEGLCWLLLYYFSEVPSWEWFYPYHYAPFASDFRGLSQLKVKFVKGLPLKPFDQLMAILPPTSFRELPLPYQLLMIDEKSKIIDFYPTEFETDVDGKRFLWQGTCKLAFIDEERLLTETRKAELELTDKERCRNVETPHRLFLRRSSKLRQQLSCHGERENSEKIEGAIAVASEIEGIKGTLHVMCEDLIDSDDEKRDEDSTDAICMFYEIPHYFQNVPRLLEGVTIPEKTVYRDDVEDTVLWHERNRNRACSWRNNHTSRGQKPDLASQSSTREDPNRDAAGLFRPSFRNYGNTGHQQSTTGFKRYDNNRGCSEGLGFPQPGSSHHVTLSYRPCGSNSQQSRADASQDWRSRNYVEVSGPRQHPNQSSPPNGGRGLGGQGHQPGQTFWPNGGGGRGLGGQGHQPGQTFWPNGGRGRGLGGQGHQPGQTFWPNGGRGRGLGGQGHQPGQTFWPNGGRGRGLGGQGHQPGQTFWLNGGRGRGQGRGWSETKS